MHEHQANHLNWSEHATKRAQQRGVATRTVQLIAAMADRRMRVPGGAHALSVSQKAATMLINSGIAAETVERTRNIVLVVDYRTDTLITVEHGHGRKRRFRR